MQVFVGMLRNEEQQLILHYFPELHINNNHVPFMTYMNVLPSLLAVLKV